MEMALAAIVALVVGLVIGILYERGPRQRLAAEASALRSQLEETKRREAAQLEEARSREEAQRAHVRELLDRVKAEGQERLKEEKEEWREESQRLMAEQEKRFDETLAKVSAQVKSTTDDMLRQRQREFAESSQQNLGQIVTPLRETIDKMKQSMADSALRQTELSGQLKANIEQMIRQSEAARRSAEELTRAFKHGSKVQGDWGERVLSELLDGQGLTQGVHYDVQTYIRDTKGNIVTDDKGAMMRPDVILHLDQRREVIIDSKVSMTAFMDYVNAETEQERDRCLKLHVDSIRQHVKELATKDYSSYIQPPKVRMDYVIMFVPHSGALWAALNAQPDLWRKAMERNVFIADEQTLFAALRIISLTWTQIAQAQNHEKVYALAAEMLDRVGQFVKKYQALGKALETAQKAYEDGDRKLQPTGQSILQTSAKLIKLGARQSDKNPLPQLTDIDDIPQIESQTLSLTQTGLETPSLTPPLDDGELLAEENETNDHHTGSDR
ncbi:MAG: DNA recombination protein RmuC [Prevotella sp.]|nr:DNA recombination protein RmuC [Prevotella sp.]